MRRGSHTGSVTSLSSKISEHSEPLSLGIVPLKPPSRPERPQTAPTHHIIVESPFGPQVDSKKIERRSSIKLVKDQIAASRRNSSIDAKKIFSAPFIVLRGKRDKRQGPSSAERLVGTASRSWLRPSNETQGHKSLLKGDQTATTLQQASTLLRGNKRILSPKQKTWNSGRSPDANSTRPSYHRVGSTQSGSKEKLPVSNSPGHQSCRDNQVASTTTSILDMQMGETPQNTPVETATYKVKRSASAETEEFLKIDISIHGGTSYLPSEARRIHTPPLPGDDTIGHSSRGFFFNYHAPDFTPDDDASQVSHPQSPQISQQQSPQSIANVSLKPPSEEQLIHRVKTKLNIHSLAPALRVPTTKLGLKVNRSKLTQKKTGDWYEARLADIDAASSITDLSSPANWEVAEQKAKRKRECQQNIADVRKQEYESQLDYTIPEHLPTSPLCPRNPKYWRVVKNKGSQFRGCWMHGFGEYEADKIPGLPKGGVLNGL